MTWSDLPFQPKTKALRQFAVAWLVFFLALGAQQGLARGRASWGLALAGLAIVVGVAGLIKPVAIRWIFVGAMVLAFPIGWLISQLTLALMFYGIITPVACFFRIRSRDLLGRKPRPLDDSYWRPKQIPEDVRRYYRQY